jgi:spectinomycin phosphotransferase
LRSLPEDLEVAALIDSLAEGWGFDTKAVEYAAVGGGSYHWIVTDDGGARGFVNVDDLDRKPWLGDTRDGAFDGLRCAFDTAAALHDSGLGFVVAPIPASGGETVHRLTPRYSIALFPFVEGQTGRFGQYEPTERAAIVRMLAELHDATAAVASLARRIDLTPPGRIDLEQALNEIDWPWRGGPFSEPAREALARRASEVVELLALADRLSVAVAQRGDDWVVTHGEPHAANVIWADSGHGLVDWDTVALAPPERDLWMLVDDALDVATVYAGATGHELDDNALLLFRLTWDLADIAAFLSVLKAPHRSSGDTKHAYESLMYYLANPARWASLLG